MGKALPDWSKVREAPRVAGAGALALRGEATGVGLGLPGAGKASATLHHPTPSCELTGNMDPGFSQHWKRAR